MLKIIAHPHHPYRLGDFLLENLRDSKWTHFRAAVAFVKASGTRYIAPDIKKFSAENDVCMSVGIDHGGSSVEGLSQLLSVVLPPGQLWVYKNPRNTFHPKVYLFKNSNEADLIIGSGNLTKGGLFENAEIGVRVQLDLNIASDVELLKELEATLDIWSTPRPGECLALDTALLDILRNSGELPTEAESAAAIQAVKSAGNSSAAKTPSPFKSTTIQSAPPFPAGSVISAATMSSTAKPSPTPVPASVSPPPSSTSSPTSSAAVPPVVVTFGMTLQNTDVGVGQVTAGTSKRSPEIFIPLAALDEKPWFWGWTTANSPDPSKYQADLAWRATNSAWQTMQLGTGRARPVDKLDWYNVKVSLKGHAVVLDVRFWYNPKKLDIRMRENNLRAAGDVGDILLIRPAPPGSARHYDMEVVKKTDPNYAITLSKLSKRVNNSLKRFGYF